MNPAQPPDGAYFDQYAGLWLIVCVRCGRTKTQLSFRIDRRCPNGFDAVCKECRLKDPPEKS